MNMEEQAVAWLRTNLVHRGQWCGAGALRSNMLTMAFGSLRAAHTYASSPNDRALAAGSPVTPEVFTAQLVVSRVYCKSDMDHPDGMFDLDVIGDEFGGDVILALTRDFGDAIRHTCGYDALREETGRNLEEMIAAWPHCQKVLPPIPAHDALRVPEFVDALRNAGYDAVACGGAGETACEMEWHIFNAEVALDPLTGDPLPAVDSPIHSTERNDMPTPV